MQRNLSDSVRPKFQTVKVFASIEVLREYPAAFWVDASVRFLSNKINPAINLVSKNSGLVFFVAYTFQSTFEVTHPNTFEYLPTNISAAQKIKHVETSSFLILRTQTMYRNILWWWYLCSLTKDCIMPTFDLKCDFMKRNPNYPFRKTDGATYQGCHKMEQSVLNILAGNLYDFNVSAYTVSYADRVTLLRFDSELQGVFKVKQCPS